MASSIDPPAYGYQEEIDRIKQEYQLIFNRMRILRSYSTSTNAHSIMNDMEEKMKRAMENEIFIDPVVLIHLDNLMKSWESDHS